MLVSVEIIILQGGGGLLPVARLSGATDIKGLETSGLNILKSQKLLDFLPNIAGVT